MVTTALGFTPYNSTNPSGYITGITSGMVTTALGFTPYDATNPDGYITSSALSTYVPYTGATGNVDLGTRTLFTPLVQASGTLTLNGNGGNVVLKSYNATIFTYTTQGFSATPLAASSGFSIAFSFTKPNNTNQTASSEIPGWNYLGGTRQWATGNITTQRENAWGAVTYSFVGASTITNAYGNVFNSPVAGTNATITNNWSAQFNGNVVIGSTGQLIEIKQTTNAPSYIQTGATSSIFRLNSGTRSLLFETYSGDSNYFSSTGASFRIRTTDGNAIDFQTGNTSRVVVLATGGILMRDANNFTFNATTGTKIGTAITEKLSFWNATPIVQPTTSVAASTFVANTSMILNDTATFDGYTIGQVVKALRNIGLLA